MQGSVNIMGIEVGGLNFNIEKNSRAFVKTSLIATPKLGP